jgi:hypothetical protein
LSEQAWIKDEWLDRRYLDMGGRCMIVVDQNVDAWRTFQRNDRRWDPEQRRRSRLSRGGQLRSSRLAVSTLGLATAGR